MNEHVKNVCMIGQGHGCCRYLVVGGNGFECGKLDMAVKTVLDRRVLTKSITAQADNCDGKEIGELNDNGNE